MELDGYAHWIGEGSDRGVEINAGGVQGVKEVNQSVVDELFQVEDKLTNCNRDFSRVVPPENMYDRALIDGMIRINHLRSGEVE